MHLLQRALLALIASLALLALIACGDDSSPNSTPSSTSTSQTNTSQTTPTSTSDTTWTSLNERPCPEDSVLTYSNFGAGFMLDWCVSCHSSNLPAGERAGAPIGIDFNTIEDVRAHAPRIWARSADTNDTMPAYGGADLQTRTLLGEWLACGAPE